MAKARVLGGLGTFHKEKLNQGDVIHLLVLWKSYFQETFEMLLYTANPNTSRRNMTKKGPIESKIALYVWEYSCYSETEISIRTALLHGIEHKSVTSLRAKFSAPQFQ